VNRDSWPEPIVATGRKLPDNLLHAMIEEGLRNVDIQRHLAARGIHVSRSALSMWRSRHGYAVRQPTAAALALIPWKVAQRHASDAIYGALLIEARRRTNNISLTTNQLSRRNWLLKKLGPGLVVHYDQTTGWCLLPRRTGIDNDWIREPGLDDAGTPVPGWRPRCTQAF
jgi:hypothetical protein